MRRAVLLWVLLFIPGVLVAQDRDESWRDRGARDQYRYARPENLFEITPFGGYRYGGTIFAEQTDLFGTDLELESRGNIGVMFGIPIGNTGFKLELMVNHQSTTLTTERGLFDPGAEVADLDVTYYHGGVLIPFAVSRNAIPFFVVSAGVTNLDLRGGNSDNRFSASAGIGVKVPLSRNLSFRAEARGYFSSLGDDDNCRRCDFDDRNDLYQGETNFGLAFSF